MLHIFYKLRIHGAGHKNHTVGRQQHGGIAYFLGRHDVRHAMHHHNARQAFLGAAHKLVGQQGKNSLCFGRLPLPPALCVVFDKGRMHSIPAIIGNGRQIELAQHGLTQVCCNKLAVHILYEAVGIVPTRPVYSDMAYLMLLGMDMVAQLTHFFAGGVALNGIHPAHNHKLGGNVGNKDKQAHNGCAYNNGKMLYAHGIPAGLLQQAESLIRLRRNEASPPCIPARSGVSEIRWHGTVLSACPCAGNIRLPSPKISG